MWNWTETKYIPKVLDYKIIKGLPSTVEETVLALLDEGWSLNGELIPMKVDGLTIVAQGMLLYRSEGEKQNDKTSKV